MANYTPQGSETYPVNPRIIACLEQFYRIADNNDLIDEFADCYTPTGTLISGKQKAVGRAEILVARKKAVTGPHIVWRRHRAGRIFQFGKDSGEIMVYGVADYKLTNGKEVPMEWASRGILVEHEGKMKLDFYQTYAVSIAPQLPGWKAAPTRSRSG